MDNKTSPATPQGHTATKGLRYRPSSSAWQWGALTLTQYNSGCLRSIVLEQLLDHKPDIDPIYQRLGAHHEEVLERELGDKVADRELVIKAPITERVNYSGRADFILTNGVIIEAKASLVKGRSVKIPETPKASHVSQVVSYMLQLERPVAWVVWGHYKEAKDGGFEAHGERRYRVELADNGRVVIDKQPTAYFAQDQLAHMHAAARALESGEWETLPRPYNWAAKFGSPCSYCPFKQRCQEVE